MKYVNFAQVSLWILCGVLLVLKLLLLLLFENYGVANLSGS